MATLKTTRNDNSVIDFINQIDSETKRKDSFELLKIFEEISGEKPAMWGDSIIGFGSYHYKSEKSSQEGDWPLTGFSPRKQNLTIYIMPGFDKFTDELAQIGKYKNSISCLYINKLSDINIDILKQIIRSSLAEMKRRYPAT